MGLSSSAILDKHLATLHHLDVLIFRQWLFRVEIKEWSHTSQDPFDILRISLKLIGADSLIDLFELLFGVSWSPLRALLFKLFKGQPMLGIHISIVI